MKKRNTVSACKQFVRKHLVPGLIVLISTFFVTCNNPIMEKWWPEPTETNSAVSPGTNYFIVVFNTNGGSPVPAYQRVIPDSKVSKVPVTSKGNFGFGGWYTDGNFTKLWDFANDTVTSDMTLYARWEASTNSFTVTFEPNGGTPTPLPQTVANGSRAVEPEAMKNILEPDKGFGGWFEDQAFTQPWNFAKDTVSTDLTLYAKWATPPPPVYNVTFVEDGGIPAPPAQLIVQGARVVEPFAMNKEGYAFGGWYRDNLALTSQWNFATDTVSADITLYAKWAPINLTVSFDTRGGSPVPKAQTVSYNTKINEPSQVFMTGYGFDCWCTDPGCALGTEWDINTGQVTADMTLYARWKLGVYTVTFIPNNGDPAFYDSTVSAHVDEPAKPVLANHEFDGWYKSPGFAIGDLWNFNTDAVSSDMILYGRWVADPAEPVETPDTDYPGGMVYVPSGTFMMGDDGVSGAKPAHLVVVNGFYMDTYQVPQWKYGDIMKGVRSNPWPSNASKDNRRPVERVSWYDAVEYCIELTKVANKPVSEGGLGLNLSQVYTISNKVTKAISGTGTPGIPSVISATVTVNWNATGYRLPTEAEWEYAAKARNGWPLPSGESYYIYSGSNTPSDVAWYNQTVSGQVATTSTPVAIPTGGATQFVGLLNPNAFGLCDMSGNVCEWCWDWFDPNYYTLTPVPGPYTNNPRGPDTGTEKVRRGGVWSNAFSNVRTVVRNSFTPDNNTWVMGFRTVRSQPPAP